MSLRPQAPRRRGRPGFTLVELMMAVTLMLMVFAAAVPFFRAQARSIEDQAGRFDATQTARFAISMVDKDLRVAGNWLGVGQPLLVQADTLAVTFNADLVSRGTGDEGLYAVYTDSSATTTAAWGLTTASRVTLPNSTRQYPDSTYRVAGTTIPVKTETISYYVTADARPAFAGRFKLMRRVNTDSATLVAENVVLTPGERVFRYFHLGTGGVLTEIPPTRFPLFHTVAMHGSAADTGSFRMTDSVRVVRMRLTVADPDPRRGERRQTFESNIRLRNAGLLNRPSCGRNPTLGAIALSVTGRSGPSRVVVTWNPATDEAGGERDVQAYLIHRRRSTESTFGSALASVPADGSSPYEYTDTALLAGERYVYGIAAVDCTPAMSGTVASSTVTVP